VRCGTRSDSQDADTGVLTKERNGYDSMMIRRMLLVGAAIVPFANEFVDKFKAAKSFVLFAIYIWEYGGVTRFLK
jgi:hypothetical protein